jgi:hypothetical protein
MVVLRILHIKFIVLASILLLALIVHTVSVAYSMPCTVIIIGLLVDKCAELTG